MKIWASLEFSAESAKLRPIVAALCGLPGKLRPTHHSMGEGERRTPIGDVGRFLDSLSGGLGPFLRGRNAAYMVGTDGEKVSCQLKVEPPLAVAFLERMASENPVFGFACAWEELLHRNQVVVKTTVGTSNKFLGRNLAKWVPGLYWLTLLPEALAERHGVPLAEVEAEALEQMSLGNGQRLFRFYDHPEDWCANSRTLDGLCATLSGVFSIAEARSELEGIDDFWALRPIYQRWD